MSSRLIRRTSPAQTRPNWGSLRTTLLTSQGSFAFGRRWKFSNDSFKLHLSYSLITRCSACLDCAATLGPANYCIRFSQYAMERRTSSSRIASSEFLQRLQKLQWELDMDEDFVTCMHHDASQRASLWAIACRVPDEAECPSQHPNTLMWSKRWTRLYEPADMPYRNRSFHVHAWYASNNDRLQALPLRPLVP